MAELRGGDKFKRRLEELARKTEEQEVAVGFGWNDSYPDGTPLALVAALNEYGAPSRGIPPRPFMRLTIARNRAGWPALAAARLKFRNGDVAAALADVGEVIKGQIEDTILSDVPPPNSPATIARKGHGATLRDTKFMLQHVRWVVRRKTGD